MTVVAYRDGIVAWDSQISEGRGGTTNTYPGIKGFKNDEIIAAGCGDMYGLHAMLTWLNAGEIPGTLPRRAPKEEYEVLILRKGGLIEFMDYRGRIMVVHPDQFYAMGSGSPAALAAMHCGKSAAEACEIATLVDAFCGGEIISHSW